MIKLDVCIGSNCHLKGSRAVVEALQKLVANGDLKTKIDLSSVFCMGKCSSNGVSVTVDGEYYAVTPETVNEFFEDKVLSKIGK